MLTLEYILKSRGPSGKVLPILWVSAGNTVVFEVPASKFNERVTGGSSEIINPSSHSKVVLNWKTPLPAGSSELDQLEELLLLNSLQ
jgi:hypothetical protein